MPTAAFQLAIKPLGVKSFEDNVLTIISTTALWSKTVKTKYSNDILRALRKYSRNPEADFEIVVDKNYKTEKPFSHDGFGPIY